MRHQGGGGPPDGDHNDRQEWWRAISKANTISAIGFISGIIAIIQLVRQGDNTTLLIALLVLALVALTNAAGAIRRYLKTLTEQRVRRLQLANFLIAAVWLFVVGAMTATLIPMILRSPPPPSVIYLAFEGTGDTDERPGLGPPIVLRAMAQSPTEEYRVRETLGLGYPVDATTIPGTHLVYDHFCRGGDSDELCGGVRRSHFYSTNQNARPNSWIPMSPVEPVARFLNADSDGECPEEASIAIYSFKKEGANEAELFDVAERAADGSWERVDLLGCLRPA